MFIQTKDCWAVEKKCCRAESDGRSTVVGYEKSWATDMFLSQIVELRSTEWRKHVDCLMIEERSALHGRLASSKLMTHVDPSICTVSQPMHDDHGRCVLSLGLMHQWLLILHHFVQCRYCRSYTCNTLDSWMLMIVMKVRVAVLYLRTALVTGYSRVQVALCGRGELSCADLVQ